MKYIKWLIAAISICAISGSCFAAATDDSFKSPPWGLAGDEQSAEDIPVRDSASGLVGTTVEAVLVGLVDGTEVFQSLTVTGALTAGSQTTTDTDIVASSIILTGMATLDGGLTMDVDKFTVDDGSGNTLIGGTLTVAGTVSITGDLTAPTIAGATAFAGKITANDGVTLGAGDDLIGSSTSDINIDSVFTVDGASGNTVVGGTFAVTSTSVFTGAITANDGITLGAGDDLIGGATSDINMNSLFTVAGASGDLAINTNKFTVAGASGNTLVAGTLDVTGNVAVNTNKFTVAASSGNTLVAGTLAVTSTTVFTGAITANGGITLGGDDDLLGSATSDINMNSGLFTVAGASGDLAINTNKFTVAGSTGNTIVAGTLGVTGVATFTAGITANGGITLGDGDDLIGSSTSDITINTNKFTVSGSDGNTLIAGTLTQTGVASFAATAVFSGGQTRKEQLTGTQVTVDGTAGPTLGVIGTTAQSQANVWQFDADPGGTDDWVFLRWAVPDGYVVGSARLNIIYSYSTAETDGDSITFDFTADALTPGTAAAGGTPYDQAGTAGDAVAVRLVNGSGDQGKLMALQIDIEGTAETFAVDDMMVIGFFVDESECDLGASGTVDIHSFEIEWESTE